MEVEIGRLDYTKEANSQRIVFVCCCIFRGNPQAIKSIVVGEGDSRIPHPIFGLVSTEAQPAQQNTDTVTNARTHLDRSRIHRNDLQGLTSRRHWTIIIIIHRCVNCVPHQMGFACSGCCSVAVAGGTFWGFVLWGDLAVPAMRSHDLNPTYLSVPLKMSPGLVCINLNHRAARNILWRVGRVGRVVITYDDTTDYKLNYPGGSKWFSFIADFT